MSQFPILKTGAIAQYPLTSSLRYNVRVLRFLDGADQRFPLQGRQLRCWSIDLSLLSETESSNLVNFFEEQKGSYSTFTFPDPLSSSPVPNCRFAGDVLDISLNAFNSAGATVWVIETNG